RDRRPWVHVMPAREALDRAVVRHGVAREAGGLGDLAGVRPQVLVAKARIDGHAIQGPLILREDAEGRSYELGVHPGGDDLGERRRRAVPERVADGQGGAAAL